MTLRIIHPFVSTITDLNQSGVVGPDDWNDDHGITGVLPIANGGTGSDTGPVINEALVDSFGNDGASGYPIYGSFVQPQALYDNDSDSGSDKTWCVYQGFFDGQRLARLRYYDHSTASWSDVYTVGVIPQAGDDHGQPVIGIDDDGYLHVIFGYHTGNQYEYVSNSPRDPSAWTLRNTFTGTYTYPHLINVGGVFYLFFRDGNSGAGDLVLFKSASISGGVTTWNSVTNLLAWSATNGVYMTTAEVVGSNIHFIATPSTGGGRGGDVYYFIYNTSTGALSTINSATTVASGSLPISLASSSSFLINSGGAIVLGEPTFAFDTNGNQHFLYPQLNGGSTDLVHIVYSGGVAGTEVVVDTFNNNLYAVALIQMPSGQMQAYWSPNVRLAAGDTVSDILTATYDGSAWGTTSTFRTSDGINGFGAMYAVKSPHVNARLIFGEEDLHTSGQTEQTRRVWAYGDGGYLFANPCDAYRRFLVDYGQTVEVIKDKFYQVSTNRVALIGEGLGVTRGSGLAGDLFVWREETITNGMDIGYVTFYGSTGGLVDYWGYIANTVIDASTSSRDSAIDVYTKVANADARPARFGDGVVIGGTVATFPGVGSVSVDKFVEFNEMVAPSTGAANTARLFCRDNGSGKTQLCVIFGSGSVIPLTTEA